MALISSHAEFLRYGVFSVQLHAALSTQQSFILKDSASAGLIL